MKDVVSCDKLRGAAHKRYIRRFPNGTTQYTEGVLLRKESQPRELKHLSTGRKRKQISDSLSSGERKGNSPNFGGVLPEGCRTAFRNHHQVKSSGKLSHRG